jgi:hypothetical protein
MQPCLLPQTPYPLQQNPTQQHDFASETFNRHNTLPKVFTTGVHAREGLTRLLNWQTCILCYGQLAVQADHMNPGLCVSKCAEGRDRREWAQLLMYDGLYLSRRAHSLSVSTLLLLRSFLFRGVRLEWGVIYLHRMLQVSVQIVGQL